MAKAKKQEKLNDKVKTKKIKKVDIDKYTSEESKEVKKFIIIFLSIIVLVLAVYGITRLINKNKDDNSNDTTVTAGSIDYDKVSVGTLFNRADDEYYVIVYDGEAPNAIYYSALMNKYMDKEKSNKVYFCDLSNELNKKYYASQSFAVNKEDRAAVKIKNIMLVKIRIAIQKLQHQVNLLSKI